jgi:hypothetical protein
VPKRSHILAAPLELAADADVIPGLVGPGLGRFLIVCLVFIDGQWLCIMNHAELLALSCLAACNLPH